MSKKKYFVVWEGIRTGVFSSWAECNKQVKGYQSAKYKSFKTKELAEKAFNGNYFDFVGKNKVFEPELTAEQLETIGKPILDTISVDAACSGNPGKMEYRGVYTKTKQQLFIKGPYKNGTNNIGEFLALVHGLAFLKRKNINKAIYSDSKIAMKWVKIKKCKTRLEKTNENKELFDIIARAELWLKNNEYSTQVLKWETKAWGEIPADFGRK